MKFVDEFRDPAAARKLLAAIEHLAGSGPDHFKFMEVCGGHTHTIYRHGIEHLLPDNVELVHGPGCPVCVIPMGRIDDAMWLAGQPDVIFTCFGDMMRVPGSAGSLLDAKARGADVRFVYSPLDALKIAVDNPDKHVVFFAIGFETTAPSTAVTLVRARDLGLRNFSVFCNHVTIVPPIKAILESPDLRLSGFIGPGHVSTVVGNRPYRFVTEVYRKPLVVAGFEPLDILAAVTMLLRQIREGRCEVENQYKRVVPEDGNPAALALMGRVFALRPHFEWRGLGFISQSALRLHDDFAEFDAELRLLDARRAGRRPEGVPVRRGAQGRAQALGMQGFRHRMHPGDPDRHLHGVTRGSLRGLLQLRPHASRRRQAGGANRAGVTVGPGEPRRRDVRSVRPRAQCAGLLRSPTGRHLAGRLGRRGAQGRDTVFRGLALLAGAHEDDRHH
jgi:hydrogenase expression/formation protein HypD